MSSDFILIVGLALLSYAAKAYSSIISLVYENILSNFFKSLRPNYFYSYIKAFILSLVSFRNQGISFTSLSFLNSGITPPFQALGLILGSYLGLALSVFYVSLHAGLLKFYFVALGLLLGLFAHKQKPILISRMFFYLAMILFAFDLIVISIQSHDTSYIFLNIEKFLSLGELAVVPFSLVLYVLFNNSFSVLCVLYALFLKGTINHELVLNSTMSVAVFNSIWYLWATKNSHRETRGVSYSVLIISVITALIVILIQGQIELRIQEVSKGIASFALDLILLAVIMGVVGFFVSLNIERITNVFFPKGKLKEPRQIILLTSYHHYPVAFLIEYFEQEYKKLFAHINSAQQMINEKEFERAQKYFDISRKIINELENLEVKINQKEKTRMQAEKIFYIHDRISGIKDYSETLLLLFELKRKIEILNDGNIKLSTLIANSISRYTEIFEYIFSRTVEKDKIEFNIDQLKNRMDEANSDVVTTSLELRPHLDDSHMKIMDEFLSNLRSLSRSLLRVASS